MTQITIVFQNHNSFRPLSLCHHEGRVWDIMVANSCLFCEISGCLFHVTIFLGGISNVRWLPRWLSDTESSCQCRRCRRWGWIASGEDPLEEEMTTHSSILAWIIPWGVLQATYSPWDSKESDTTEWLNAQNNVICNCTYNGNCYNYHWGGQGNGEWGRLSPRHAGPQGADPETAARWRQASQVVPGCAVLDARGPGLGDGLSASPGDSRAGPLLDWWAQDPLSSGLSLSGVSLHSREPALRSETGFGHAHLIQMQYGSHNSAKQAEGRCPPPSCAVGSLLPARWGPSGAARAPGHPVTAPKLCVILHQSLQLRPRITLATPWKTAHTFCAAKLSTVRRPCIQTVLPCHLLAPLVGHRLQSFPAASSPAACPCAGQSCSPRLWWAPPWKSDSPPGCCCLVTKTKLCRTLWPHGLYLLGSSVHGTVEEVE